MARTITESLLCCYLADETTGQICENPIAFVELLGNTVACRDHERNIKRDCRNVVELTGEELL